MTKPKKIAFQGEPGANSHLAIVEAYPDAEPLPCATFEDALAAIRSPDASQTFITCCRRPACLSSANGFCRSGTS